MELVELIFKFILVLFVSGSFNIIFAFCMAVEKLEEKLRRKWVYVFIIVTSLGIVSMVLLGIIDLPKF
jgi:hypothetical protein